jgi:hypothetical protein
MCPEKMCVRSGSLSFKRALESCILNTKEDVDMGATRLL